MFRLRAVLPFRRISVAISLVIADVSHGHTVDSLTLGVGLIIANSTHTQTVDALTLGLSLIIAQATHGHSADGIALTQHNILVIADTTQTQTADNLVTEYYGLPVEERIYWVKAGRR